MPLDHNSIAPKSINKGHAPSSGNRCQITILACSNVVSIVLPPMVICKGEHLNYEWTKGEIPKHRIQNLTTRLD